MCLTIPISKLSCKQIEISVISSIYKFISNTEDEILISIMVLSGLFLLLVHQICLLAIMDLDMDQCMAILVILQGMRGQKI